MFLPPHTLVVTGDEHYCGDQWRDQLWSPISTIAIYVFWTIVTR